jgi:hypothetical protein
MRGGPYLPYDKGGLLPPGASLAVNNTGQPEMVLTAEQWRTLADSAASRQVINTLPERIAAALAAATATARPGHAETTPRGGDTFNIPVYPAAGMDEETLGKAVAREIAWKWSTL